MKEYPFLSRVSSLTGRAVAFFFLVSLLLFFLYILGNSQDFLDSTQIFILSLLRASLSLELLTSLWLAGLLGHRTFNERRPFVVRWTLLSLSLILSVVLLTALRFVQQWLHF